MWKYLLVLCLLVAVCHVEARRGRPGRGGGRGGRARRVIPSEATELADWVRALDGNVEAQESAHGTADQVYILSQPSVRRTRFKPSLTVYDFTGDSPMAVVKVKKACYLMDVPQDLTKESLVSQVSAYSGARREAGGSIEMFAVDPTEAQTQSVQNRPAVSSVCTNRRMRMTLMALSVDQPPTEGKIKTLKVSTLDSLLFIKKIKASGGRNRAGGDAEGRRRNGGRRRNRGGRGRQ